MRIWIALLLLSGCTVGLWQDDYYKEQLNGFYLTSEKNHFIVAGSKYSYVFDIDNQFADILLTSRSIEYTPLIYDFMLDVNNNISGKVIFRVRSEKLSEEDVKTITKLGFYAVNDSLFRYSDKLSGKIYKLEGELPFMPLEDKHIIRVRKTPGVLLSAGKIAVTPATLAFDAFVIIPILMYHY